MDTTSYSLARLTAWVWDQCMLDVSSLIPKSPRLPSFQLQVLVSHANFFQRTKKAGECKLGMRLACLYVVL